eukprot:1993665-Pleurochrysis_carterae.AAC.1
MEAVEASVWRRRSATARARRAEAWRSRTRDEFGRVVNVVPVAVNRGGGGSRKNRPPAMTYAWTRHRPHAQGRSSGDEVTARARAPTRSAT